MLKILLILAGLGGEVMFTEEMQSAKPVLENMALPDVFYTSGDGTGGVKDTTVDAAVEKRLSTLEMAFFFRGSDARDVSLVRNRVVNLSSGESESILDNGVIRLPNINKAILKQIFREAFHDRCPNYDDVELISEALAQNCIVQLRCESSDRLRGAFKMTLKREFTLEGVSDFSFALSAFKSEFQGLDALEGKCDITFSQSSSGKRHKVEVRPKKLRRPSTNHSQESAAIEIKEVLDNRGSIMIPEYTFRRELVCKHLLASLGFSENIQKKLLGPFVFGITQLEQSGFAFRGKGIVAYVTAGENKKAPTKVGLILRPFPEGSYPDTVKLEGLREIFVREMDKADPYLRCSRLFKIDVFEAVSFFFDGHAAIELSRLRA